MSKSKNVSVMKQCFSVQQLHERDIKCVVVGDTAVGKTKLVHSYSCNLPEIDISELNVRKHMPSILVLENCRNVVKNNLRFNVNNINATVTIWDTFGDHEKNREYSYCNADIVIICFSIGELESLNNVVSHWYPEVRSFCPKVPILLVGTQCDRRHHDLLKYMTPIKKKTLGEYLGLRPETSLSSRINLVEPEIGRAVANAITARQYIETSVVTKHGVHNVFVNAVKFALDNSSCSCLSLSSSKILIQKPFLPTKKIFPEVKAIVGIENAFFTSLFSPYEKHELYDITFIIDGHEIYGHTVILMLASCLFHEVVVHAYSVLYTSNPTKYSPEIESRECITSSGVEMSLPQGFRDVQIDEYTSHVEISLEYLNVQQFVTILEFYYTGEIGCIKETESLFQATYFLQLPLLSRYLYNLLQDDMTECQQVQKELSRKYSQHGNGLIGSEFFSDFKFCVEDSKYSIHVHKVILTQRCQIMSSMFQNGHFIESRCSEVILVA